MRNAPPVACCTWFSVAGRRKATHLEDGRIGVRAHTVPPAISADSAVDRAGALRRQLHRVGAQDLSARFAAIAGRVAKLLTGSMAEAASARAHRLR